MHGLTINDIAFLSLGTGATTEDEGEAPAEGGQSLIFPDYRASRLFYFENNGDGSFSATSEFGLYTGFSGDLSTSHGDDFQGVVINDRFFAGHPPANCFDEDVEVGWFFNLPGNTAFVGVNYDNPHAVTQYSVSAAHGTVSARPNRSFKTWEYQVSGDDEELFYTIDEVTGEVDWATRETRIFCLEPSGGWETGRFCYWRLFIEKNNAVGGQASLAGTTELGLREDVGGKSVTEIPGLTGQSYRYSQESATAGFEARFAFDGATGQGSGWSTQSAGLPHWAGIRLPYPAKVVEYTVGSYPGSTDLDERSPMTWRLEATNNEYSGWTIIHSVTGENSWEPAERREYRVDTLYEGVDPLTYNNRSLSCLLRADNLVFEDGGNVTEWNDIGPSGFEFARETASEQPEFLSGIHNGHHAVFFDGVDEMLTGRDYHLYNNDDGFTLLAVVSGETANTDWFFNKYDSTNNTREWLAHGARFTVQEVNNSTDGDTAVDWGDNNSTDIRILAGIWNPARAITTWHSGTTTQEAVSNITDMHHTDSQPVNIGGGGLPGSEGNFFRGMIFELATFHRALNSQELNEITKFYKSRYGELL